MAQVFDRLYLDRTVGRDFIIRRISSCGRARHGCSYHARIFGGNGRNRFRGFQFASTVSVGRFALTAAIDCVAVAPAVAEGQELSHKK